MLINHKDIHVEWGDCDPGGIVYFPRYFEYCDSCTVAFFEKAGLFKPTMLKKYGIDGIPMVDVHATYYVPSQYGDIITVETRISAFGRTSFSVHHKLYKGDVLAVEVFEKRAWVARISHEPVRFKAQSIPEEVKEIFLGSAPPANIPVQTQVAVG